MSLNDFGPKQAFAGGSILSGIWYTASGIPFNQFCQPLWSLFFRFLTI